MTKLILVLSILCNFSYAQIKIENNYFEQINKDQTCLDEYMQRDDQLRKWLIWSPPLTIVATPIALATGLVAGSVASKAVGVTGWSQLGAALGSGMILGGVAAISGVTIEIVTAIKFNRNRTMLRAIVESHNNNFKGKNLNRLTRKFNRKYDRSMTSKEMADVIVQLDSTQELCDGRLKRKVKSSKLKHLLAKRKDLFNYLK